MRICAPCGAALDRRRASRIVAVLAAVGLAGLRCAPRCAPLDCWCGAGRHAGAYRIVARCAVVNSAMICVAPRGATRQIRHAFRVVTRSAFVCFTRLCVAPCGATGIATTGSRCVHSRRWPNLVARATAVLRAAVCAGGVVARVMIAPILAVPRCGRARCRRQQRGRRCQRKSAVHGIEVGPRRADRREDRTALRPIVT